MFENVMYVVIGALAYVVGAIFDYNLARLLNKHLGIVGVVLSDTILAWSWVLKIKNIYTGVWAWNAETFVVMVLSVISTVIYVKGALKGVEQGVEHKENYEVVSVIENKPGMGNYILGFSFSHFLLWL